MTEKRFYIDTIDGGESVLTDNGKELSLYETCNLLNELNDKCEVLEIENESFEDGATKYAELYHKSLKENEQLKYKINDLLYQIEYIGKNNKSCDGCECFLEDIGYCWMWDMNVKKEDIVVACDQRKVKNTK